MRRVIHVMLLLIITTLCIGVFVACDKDNSNTPVELHEDDFSKLIVYCESNSIKQTDNSNDKEYYTLSWKDSDSSQTGEVEFTLQIYEDKTMLITGVSIFPYNSGIQYEITYSVEFLFGSESDDRLSYEVKFYALSRRLQDQYNYYPYVIDEYRMSDSKSIFDIKSWSASCYYETSSSTQGVISFSDPNQTLRDVSEDSFDQIKKYLENRVNISLFIND